MDFETGLKILTFVNKSPVFKGTALIILAMLSLLFALWVGKREKEKDFNFWLFVSFAVFIFIYGLFILIIRPNWWLLPY